MSAFSFFTKISQTKTSLLHSPRQLTTPVFCSSCSNIQKTCLECLSSMPLLPPLLNPLQTFTLTPLPKQLLTTSTMTFTASWHGVYLLEPSAAFDSVDRFYFGETLSHLASRTRCFPDGPSTLPVIPSQVPFPFGV